MIDTIPSPIATGEGEGEGTSSFPPEPLLIELSDTGAPGHQLPALDVPEANDLPQALIRQDLRIPEIGELDVVRHFTHLSQRNYSIDSG
ncbi:MAG TPA: hypothetical protein VK457_11415, partial [Chloroflexota bacterium]|nr:hypothetical protein [Chloroflexota bacterium]